MQAWPDGGNGGAVQSALQWVIGVLYGPLGTTIAVLAIALLGALMLAGRLPMRRGVRMVLALFLFFGGANLAGLFVDQAPSPSAEIVSADEGLQPAEPNKTNVFDPYAGASTVKN